MLKTPNIFQSVKTSPLFQELQKSLERKESTNLSGLFTSSVSVYASVAYVESDQSMLFILPDKETAAYVYNDLENLLTDNRIFKQRNHFHFYF